MKNKSVYNDSSRSILECSNNTFFQCLTLGEFKKNIEFYINEAKNIRKAMSKEQLYTRIMKCQIKYNIYIHHSPETLYNESVFCIQLAIIYLFPESQIEATGFYTKFSQNIIKDLEKQFNLPISGNITLSLWDKIKYKIEEKFMTHDANKNMQQKYAKQKEDKVAIKVQSKEAARVAQNEIESQLFVFENQGKGKKEVAEEGDNNN